MEKVERMRLLGVTNGMKYHRGWERGRNRGLSDAENELHLVKEFFLCRDHAVPQFYCERRLTSKRTPYCV